VKDATGPSLAYVYGRETRADADTAKVLPVRRTTPILCHAIGAISGQGCGGLRHEENTAHTRDLCVGALSSWLRYFRARSTQNRPLAGRNFGVEE
jgi:hypothetical protein